MNFTKKLFTTGEFADLCSVKKQTLFHYDDINLLKPEYKAENGYRYYSVQQAEIFMMIDTLKEIGMSLDEIKDFLQSDPPKNTIELLNEKEKMIEIKIQKMKMTQHMIQNHIKQIKEEMAVDLDQFTIEEMKEERLLLSENVLNFSMKEITKIIMSFMKHAKQKRFNDKGGALIQQKQLETGDYLNYSNLYVYDSPQDTAETFVKEAGIYVVGYHKDNYIKIDDTYEKMKEFMRRKGFRICGNSFEEYQYMMGGPNLTGGTGYITKIMIQAEKFKTSRCEYNKIS